MKKVTGTDTKTRPPMAMKITIGRFDDNGEPVWFDVETNEWKDENGNWKKEDEDTPPRVVKGCGEDVL